MFSQEQHFTDPIVSIITVDQQVMYEIYLHRILTKLLSVSFPMYSGDTGCGSHLQDGWYTQERPDFTDSSRDTLLLDRSVHQVGKVSCPYHLSCLCTNPAVTTIKDGREQSVRNQDHETNSEKK